MAENFNWRDFAIGVGVGWATAYVLYAMRDALGDARRGVGQRLERAQAYATLSAEGRFIREFTREAQLSHLAGERIPLHKIAIEPRFIPPARFAEPPDDDIRRDVFRVVPRLPDLPYLAQPYNVETVTLDDLYHGPGAYALLGAPGSGRSTALVLTGMVALGEIRFAPPEDKVTARLRAEEDQLDPAQRAERLKRRLTIEQEAFDQLAKESRDTGLRTGNRRQADMELIPYNDRFPVYVHLADVRPALFRGKTDPAEPLVRGLQAQVGSTTAKALPRRLYPRIEAGGCVLLLDGYDDLTPEHQAEIAAWLPELIAAHPGNHVLVAGPDHGYAPLVDAGLAPLFMRPWDDNDIETAVQKWAAAWPSYLAGSGRRARPNRDNTPSDAAIKAALNGARGLSATETTLKILAAFHGETSRAPGVWVESYLANLALPENVRAAAARAARVEIEHHRITSDMVAASTGNAEGAGDQGKLLLDLFRRGLLVEIGRGEFQFRHRAVGAYLAALSLKDADNARLREIALDPRWELALGYAAGIRSVDAAAAARLEAPSNVLVSTLTGLTRWLAYLDSKPAWRASVLRQIGNLFVQPGQYPLVRERLAAALAASRDAEATAIFERSLKSPDSDVRRLSALALGVLRSHQTVPTLVGLVRDVDPNVQLAATTALGAIGSDESYEELARAFAFGTEAVKQMAAETFAILPDVGFETLYDATRHETLEYRRASVFGLRRMRVGWALIELYRLFLEDQQWYVRLAAQEAIIDFQTHAAAKALAPYPEPSAIDWLGRWARQVGIKSEGVEADVLGRMATMPDATMQPVAVQALGQLGMLDRAGMLYRALLDGQPTVRDLAFRSLADIGLQHDAPLPSPV